MMRPTNRKQAGFDHVLLVLVFVLLFGIVGVGYRFYTNAATVSGPIVGIGNKCLDNYANLKKEGNAVILYDCNKTQAQVWTVGTDSTIKNANGYCLTATGKTSGSRVTLNACKGTELQKWTVVTATNTIVSTSSKLCLDDKDGLTTNKNPIQVATCSSGSTRQVWKPTSSSVKTPSIANFTASPTSVSSGSTSKLSWATLEATTCSITPGGPTDTIATSWTTPAMTKGTTFTLTCKNSVGATISRTITVNVSGTAVTPPTSPVPTGSLSVPAGYTSMYARDFTVANATDDAKWAATTGTAGNNAAQYIPSKVIKAGANGQELIATQASSGAVINSGAVRNTSMQIPQYHYMKVQFRAVNFQIGSWPSLWLRPHSSAPGTQASGEGEVDYIEGFGSHMDANGNKKPSFARIWGSTVIMTPYGSSQVNLTGSLDSQFPKSEWGDWHTFEFYKRKNEFITYIDGVLTSTIKRPASGAGATKWDQQMEDLTKKWYVRLDHQAGNKGTHTEAGNPTKWPFEARQQMRSMVIGVPK